MVVVEPPGLDDLSSVRQVDEVIRIEAVATKGPVEALDEAVLDRAAWPDESKLHSAACSPGVQSLADKLGSIVDDDFLGKATLFGHLVEHADDSLCGQGESTSMRRASRVPSSMTLKVRNGRPSLGASRMKSIDQRLLGRSGVADFSRSAAATSLRRGRLRSISPSSR